MQHAPSLRVRPARGGIEGPDRLPDNKPLQTQASTNTRGDSMRGMPACPSTPEEMARRLKVHYDKYRKLIQLTGEKFE